jgi:hypothetical protein
LSVGGFPDPHSSTAAILRDELNAGGFKGATDSREVEPSDNVSNVP